MPRCWFLMMRPSSTPSPSVSRHAVLWTQRSQRALAARNTCRNDSLSDTTTAPRWVIASGANHSTPCSRQGGSRERPFQQAGPAVRPATELGQSGTAFYPALVPGPRALGTSNDVPLPATPSKPSRPARPLYCAVFRHRVPQKPLVPAQLVWPTLQGAPGRVSRDGTSRTTCARWYGCATDALPLQALHVGRLEVLPASLIGVLSVSNSSLHISFKPWRDMGSWILDSPGVRVSHEKEATRRVASPRKQRLGEPCAHTTCGGD